MKNLKIRNRLIQFLFLAVSSNRLYPQPIARIVKVIVAAGHGD